MVKEMAWFKDTALSLEKLKIVHLDPEVIAGQLYEQKVRILYISILITCSFLNAHFDDYLLIICLCNLEVQFVIDL